MRWFIFGSALVVVSLGAGPLAAAPCDRLSGSQRKLSHKIFRSTHPYDCCDETLDRCLKQKKVCKLARRLRDAVCRRLAAGESEKQIHRALDRRSRSMTPMGKKASIDLSVAPPAGDPGSGVTVVAYACGRCKFCSKVIPDIYRMATGKLRGKVQLRLRVFPIRGHKDAAIAGLGLVSSLRLGKFWPFLLKVYGNFDGFSRDRQLTWAGQVGMDAAAFQRELKSKKNRKFLVKSKKEGLRNGVDATPTLFINGRRYHGDLKRDTLLDVFAEEADRVSRKQYCGP